MAKSLDVQLPKITTDKFEHSWMWFELVAATKKWKVAKQLKLFIPIPQKTPRLLC